MIKKKYPANTRRMKNSPSKLKVAYLPQKNHYASNSITVVEFVQTTYTSSTPPATTPLCEVVGLFQ